MLPASLTSSPAASPVTVTPTPVEPSIVNASVISSSPSVSRIKLLSPTPLNTLPSNVIVSAPLPVSAPGATNVSVLAAWIASRSVTTLSLKSTGKSAALLTTSVASNRRSSSNSKLNGCRLAELRVVRDFERDFTCLLRRNFLIIIPIKLIHDGAHWLANRKVELQQKHQRSRARFQKPAPSNKQHTPSSKASHAFSLANQRQTTPFRKNRNCPR